MSVCLSVTFVYCIQTAKNIINLFSQPVSPISFLVFFFAPKCYYPIPREHPSAGALNTRGWEKNCDFWLKSSFTTEMVRDSPIHDCNSCNVTLMRKWSNFCRLTKRRAFRVSATPLHLHKCVTRFIKRYPRFSSPKTELCRQWRHRDTQRWRWVLTHSVQNAAVNSQSDDVSLQLFQRVDTTSVGIAHTPWKCTHKQ